MFTTIYLSSHSDDIAFCCGGSIQKEIRPDVAILTIFSKSRYTQAKSLDNDPDIVTETRIREDQRFCQFIGASYHNLGFAEANLRGYPSLRSLYEKQSGMEDPDYQQIEKSVVDFVSPYRGAKVFSPIGIGNHIEHLITLEIAARLEKLGYEIVYYEDLPYALEFTLEEIEEIVTRNAGKRMPVYSDITDVVDRKREALRIYESQVTGRLIDEILSHSQRFFPLEQRYYERVWR